MRNLYPSASELLELEDDEEVWKKNFLGGLARFDSGLELSFVAGLAASLGLSFVAGLATGLGLFFGVGLAAGLRLSLDSARLASSDALLDECWVLSSFHGMYGRTCMLLSLASVEAGP